MTTADQGDAKFKTVNSLLHTWICWFMKGVSFEQHPGLVIARTCVRLRQELRGRGHTFTQLLDSYNLHAVILRFEYLRRGTGSEHTRLAGQCMTLFQRDHLGCQMEKAHMCED